MTSKLSMSSRTKLILSFALFAPTALIILTGPSPSTSREWLDGHGQGLRAQLGPQALAFSLIADGLALLTCLAACILILRLASRLRDRVPFGLTSYILGLFLLCFVLQRVVGYGYGRFGPELQMVSATASIVAAMGAAFLFPYVRSMIAAVDLGQQGARQVCGGCREQPGRLLHPGERARPQGGAKEIVDFRFIYVNANGERRLRKPRAELIGSSLKELLPYTVRTGLMERYKQVVQTGTPLTEEHLVERDDVPPYWIATQVVKLGDGIAVTNRDVTEERSRREQIADLNEFTQSMIENAPFSIIATDPAGTVTAMNPAAESLTFYRKHELIGQHSMVMLHDPAEMSARAVQLSKDLGQPVQAGFSSLIARPKQGQTDEHEWTYVRKDGSRIWVNLAMTALKTENQKIAGYLGYRLRHHRAKEADRVCEPPGPP